MKKEYDFSNGKRGAIDPCPSTKKRITIRLDNEIVNHFKQQVIDASGGNYQNLINQALLDHIQGENIADIIRSTVHDTIVDELKKAA